MAPYRHPDPTAWLLPVDLESQRTPGTLCHAVQHLVDDLGVSAQPPPLCLPPHPLVMIRPSRACFKETA